MARKIASIHETTKAFTAEVVSANAGTTSDTFAAGNDSRINGAVQAGGLDAAVAAKVTAPGSATHDALSATYATLGKGQTLAASLAVLAPPINTPSVTYASGESTALSSPVVYKPSRCGIGSQTLGWSGQDDPNFLFHPGIFTTGNGGNNDLALYGSILPGGNGQAARWPIIVEFTTAQTVIEFGFYSTPDIIYRLEVNGQPAIANQVIAGTAGLGSGKKMTFTFPSSRTRRIRLYLPGWMGLTAIRVPTGGSISKPADPAVRVGVVIGDSYVNGSGDSSNYPAGTSQFETWALAVLKALGCNRYVLAGIGGTGFSAGMDGGSSNRYITRLSTVLGLTPTPTVLVVAGSINDGTGAGTIQSEAEAFLSAAASVPTRIAIGTLKSSYEASHDAVASAAAAQGVTFVNMRTFIAGSGNISAPNGSGNADVFVLSDGTHPSFAAHRAIEAAIITRLMP